MRYQPHPAAVALVPQPVDVHGVRVRLVAHRKPALVDRLPMRYQPHPDAVDVYRLWNERNGGRRRSTVVPSD
ncbi:hypothetical protein JHV666_49180 [Mycobacterium avium subsp. hominissuis]